MFEKYFNGVIEQIYDKTTVVEENIVMASYNNDFSIEGLETIEKYANAGDDKYFVWHEYDPNSIVGAYDPFLDIICQMYRKYINEDFDDFLTQCEVYELHREVLKMYYETGICKRCEDVLVDEVNYEQERMSKTISLMLKTVAEYKPIVLVINRFQIASRSTMELIKRLIEKPSSKIGIVLGANEARAKKESNLESWEAISELLEDQGHIYHIGTSTYRPKSNKRISLEKADHAKVFIQFNNLIELLDYRQAYHYFSFIEKKIKFEDINIPDSIQLSLYLMHIKVAILLEDFSKALDLISDVVNLDVPEREQQVNYECSYYTAASYMYLGKLEMATDYAKRAKELAEQIGDAELVFKAELLMAQVQMSGWHNIFFCATDVKLEDHLLERLMHYNYRNYLAHIYIFAYDNKPEIVAKAYRSEAALVHFSNGIAIAKEIGNERLVYDAYQKNIMIASTNGMNEIALLYSVRTYQFIRDNDLQAAGRVFSAVGYNLSALGRPEAAGEFYQHAIALFYQEGLCEDIAEVCYNYCLTLIAQQKYAEAEVQLQIAIKIIDKLHLNSLRVCNLAKLYGLQALLSTMQGNHFDCERYLLSCSQFMSAVLVKQDEERIHDYERSDDDICIYLFAKALHEMILGELQEAYWDFDKAEQYYMRAEGNLFYIHDIYRGARVDLFERLGKTQLAKNEKLSLKQHQEMVSQLSHSFSEALLDELRDSSIKCGPITKEQIEALVKQESLAKENKRNKRQLEFIATWQRLLDVTSGRVAELVRNAVRVFLNRYGNDCVMYVRYDDGTPRLLYNDTGVVFTLERLEELEELILHNTAGYAVSKISHTFFEHRDLIDYFDADEICSFAVVPFMKNNKLDSYCITYIKMKDNWHDSVNRYLLNEDDLNNYRLLFRELRDAINRLEAYEKIFEMNVRLKETATTDTLTGITNRTGMYERIKQMWNGYENGQNKQGVAVMFVDLDNFKPYNDTYGHDIGDVVLREMASIFKNAVGDKGFVSRHGGDEFIIILYTGERDVIKAIADDIYCRIAAADGFTKVIEELLGKKIAIENGKGISCSIGIAAADEFKEEKTVDNLIRKADDSMYRVKAEGKGNYKFV